MVCDCRRNASPMVPAVNPMLNCICLKLERVKVRKKLMPVHCKRFRIEEAFGTDMPAPELVGGEIGPMHREIMAELRAIRAQMGSPGHKGGSGQMGETGKS